jgi:hypothetical protein
LQRAINAILQQLSVIQKCEHSYFSSEQDSEAVARVCTTARELALTLVNECSEIPIQSCRQRPLHDDDDKNHSAEQSSLFSLRPLDPTGPSVAPTNESEERRSVKPFEEYTNTSSGENNTEGTFNSVRKFLLFVALQMFRVAYPASFIWPMFWFPFLIAIDIIILLELLYRCRDHIRSIKIGEKVAKRVWFARFVGFFVVIAAVLPYDVIFEKVRQ